MACTECGNPKVQSQDSSKHCKPLSERQGPKLSDPNHPSNNGAFAETMASVGRMLKAGIFNKPIFIAAPRA